MLRGSHGGVSGFQTNATCRDGLKIAVTSRRRQPACLRRQNGDKTRGSLRRRRQINVDVTGLSRTSRGSRHSGIWA